MSVESLTDSELRSKLAEYGYPVGPVTQTTRKILVKKLKNLIESRGAAGSRHSLLARYSSDDTDDDTASSTTRKKKAAASNRRQTMANPMPPPAPAPPVTTTIPSRSPSKRRAGSRTSESKEIVVPDYDEPTSNTTSSTSSRVIKNVTKKVSKSYKLSTINDGLETGSDSDIPEEPEKSSAKLQNEKSYSRKDRSSADVERPTKSFVERPAKSYESTKSYEPIPRVSLTREEKYSVPLFKPNISPIAPVKEDNYKRDDTNVNELLANYESPFLSEFTRRLSSQTKTNVIPSRTYKSTGVRSPRLENKDGDTNGHFPSPKSSYSSPSSRYVSSSNDRPREVVTRSYKAPVTKEDNRNNQNMVSMILVIVLALFFGGLAIVYLGLGGKSETVPSLPMDIEVPLCKSDHDKPGVNCILEENVETVMQLLKKLRPILTRKAVAAACEDSHQLPYLTDSDIISMLKSQKVKELEITSDLHNAQLLIFENPKWGISLIEVEQGKDLEESVFDSMENVFQSRLDNKVAMVMLNPELPMMCMIKQKIMSILSTLLIMIAGVTMIFGGHLFVQWYIKYKKSTEREVFQLVSEIISMVELHHQSAMTTSPGGTQESYLAINHVRDNLIPPKDRKKMAGLWEKAVKFLDENESRIRREVQQVSGEEFHVWRWLPNVSSSPPTTPVIKKTKVWQGNAFETMEGSVNSLTCSPTPCLKIRHMFDPDVEFEDDWEIKVQDAILEKCGEGVKILHIRVDRGSREGCVYMKCFSQEDAGKAYRALHGCWFDGHLVTVKYLRLERYHERFPDAVRCNNPLKPSNNQRLSMQAHYWQSPLEAN
ncbi:inner nuclear membrane protein Man1 [Microplitis mediator]|uniref:inner nuclear membrane protein Man1 n=1 Tax=Microplitis mediator TaxID=375433 RepID=UPI0025525315|nr:inner nuclear membrane protein Man1 [Microplitis mediator]